MATAKGGEKYGGQSGETSGHNGYAGFNSAPNDPVDDGLGEVVAAGLVLALEFDHIAEAEG